MRKQIITQLITFSLIVAGIANGAAAQSTNTTKPTVVEETAQIPFQLSSQACTLRPLLPSVFFSSFGCGPCCEMAQEALSRCMTSGRYPRGACSCVQEALGVCLAGGCGPCQCCADLIRLGQQAGCGN